MDGELVSSSSSANEGDEHNNSSPLLFTYTQRFYEVFPYYLSIGMTYELFWESDCTLVKYYRKADEIRKNRRNEELWLQGAYVYEAICDVAPVLHAFAKKGTKPQPYSSKPYALTEAQRQKVEEDKARAISDKGMRYMTALMHSTNKRFEGSK